MTATNLPEGTDQIIEDSAVRAGESEATPGFGASGASGVAEPATSGSSIAASPRVGALPEDTDEASFTGDTAGKAPAVDAPETGDAPTGAAPKGSASTAAPTAEEAKAAIGDAKAKIGETAEGLKGQAADKAREYALMGKDRASETLHNVARMIDDAADTVDEKVGGQYGDYARQASGFVKNLAGGIDEKDVDELFEQARELIRRSPGVAIGAAATVGFVLARILKAGLETTTPEKDVTFTPDADLAGGKAA